jgi:galactokinase
VKNYLIIGKSPHMTSIYVKTETGEYRQVKMSRGKKIYLREDQMSFHIQRQEAHKRIVVHEISEDEMATALKEKPGKRSGLVEYDKTNPSPDVAVEEFASESTEVKPPVRRRRRRKKIVS